MRLVQGEGQALALRCWVGSPVHGEGQALALRCSDEIGAWRGTGPRPTVLEDSSVHGEGQALALRC